MVIICLDNLEQDKFVDVCSKYAVKIDDSLPLDEYIKAIEEANKKKNYVFVSSDKREFLKENNIRYYVAYKKDREVDDEKNHMRFDKDEKIYDKLGNFKDLFER